MSEPRRHHSNAWFLLALAAGFWAPLGIAFAGHQTFTSLSYTLIPGFGMATTLVVAASMTALALGVAAASKRLSSHTLTNALLIGGVASLLFASGGILRHLGAALWTAECELGRGDACHGLARYYEEGHSPVGGTLDATAHHSKACDLGGYLALLSCTRMTHFPGERRRAACVALNDMCESGRAAACGALAGACTDAPPRPPSPPTVERRCEHGHGPSCHAIGRRIESHAKRGSDYNRANDFYRRACELGDRRDNLLGCRELVESGLPQLRGFACAEIRENCRTSSAWTCAAYLRQCDEVEASPF